jgi:hypothetical protein
MPWDRRTDGWWLAGHPLAVRVDDYTGAIDRLTVGSDPDRMNWVASSDNGWHPISHGWGLGMVGGRPNAGRDDAPVRWQEATVRVDGDVLTAVYECAGWHVEVTRRPADDMLAERIVIRNDLDRPRDVGSLWLYTPFNVDVVGGAAGLRHRCHAHVWAGGRETWIKAVRWSGDAPHIALAARAGDFIGYGLDGVTEYGGSPIRGDIALVAHDVEQTSELRTLAPGDALRFGWIVYPYADDAEFVAKLGREPLRADEFVLTPGETTTVRGSDQLTLGTGSTGSLDGTVFTATAPGLATIAAGDPARPAASVVVVTVPDLDELADARARFIHERQQVTDPGSAQFGAYLPYHNGYDALLRKPPRRDYNDGRERVGMGVLLAQRRRTHPSDELIASTDRYADFVATRLQSPAGVVFDSSDDREFQRLYNYPWVCRFWLEMWAATGADRYVDRFLNTVRAFYAAGGAEFYAIGMPILRGHRLLSGRGRASDAAELVRLHRSNADFIRSRGVDYPIHEVPFEQTIVGPAATVLLELHLATGDPAFRRDAAAHLRLLELFGGPQPDGRLHDVPIRHWDGYWFGDRPRWGDVMPHHWSAVTAWAWALRGVADADATWSRRARQLSRATLHTFTPDGRASAAYVYPLIVNGQHEHSFDPLANDQDWALVTALDIRDLGRE